MHLHLPVVALRLYGALLSAWLLLPFNVVSCCIAV